MADQPNGDQGNGVRISAQTTSGSAVTGAVSASGAQTGHSWVGQSFDLGGRRGLPAKPQSSNLQAIKACRCS